MLDKLYKEYGELMIRLEVTKGMVDSVKQKIANELNGNAKAVEPKPDKTKEKKKNGK